ncbi:VCBS repeat-containing protein [Lysobacter sp. M2-1]|uniref:FG-GAP repeat domain-containing protein n=1 Tax=Lysobacter sp. M2-1 TaxID=2916839 RepID=UPI001F56DD3B|nr:VCBS repeat-containing protein [Lysobacter sp. M2-1]
MLLLLGCAVSIQPCLAKPFAFELPVNMRGGLTSSGKAVAIGDLNQDGRDDIAISQSDDTVWMHLQTATGSLQSPKAHRLQVASVHTLRAIDIDRSGSSELVAGHHNGLAVYASSRGWRYVPASAACNQLAAGDVDLDGWSDIACMDTRGIVSLYINNRLGTFSAPIFMWTPAYGSGQLQLRDVTGDGYPDLVLMASATAGFYVHPNNGSGRFFPAYGYPSVAWGPLSPGGIVALDVDADGIDELVTTSTTNGASAALHVYRKDATGFFQYAKDISTYQNPVSPIVYDIDRDGRLDLLVSHRGWSSVSRYMGGAGGFSWQAVRSMVETPLPTPSSLALGDINGDACTDLVVGNSFGMSILRGKCKSDVIYDFDGDFRSDVFWRNTVTGQNVIWRSGNASLDQPLLAVTRMAWQVVGHGDFDRDGRVDILWRNATTGSNTIWKAGNYATQQPVTALTDVRWRVAGVGDFDGDGRSDILWRHATTGANAIWKSGSYATQQTIAAVTDVYWQVVGVGDFNGDGRSDILWRHARTGANAIWKSGNHATQQFIAPMTDVRWKVAGVGDFHGLGRSDIVWRHAGTGQNMIWPQANGEFPQPLTDVTNLAWQVGAVGDYDGDGVSDLFWRNTSTGANVIWRFGNSQIQIKVAQLAGAEWTLPGQ